jgi:glutamate synthase (NADPH/NADH) small chain
MTDRQTVATDGDCHTSLTKVFACGDVATGASLVVRAMASGRATAKSIEKYLS